jgi:hypothetical protein
VLTFGDDLQWHALDNHLNFIFVSSLLELSSDDACSSDDPTFSDTASISEIFSIMRLIFSLMEIVLKSLYNHDIK